MQYLQPDLTTNKLVDSTEIDRFQKYYIGHHYPPRRVMTEIHER